MTRLRKALLTILVTIVMGLGLSSGAHARSDGHHHEFWSFPGDPADEINGFPGDPGDGPSLQGFPGDPADE